MKGFYNSLNDISMVNLKYLTFLHLKKTYYNLKLQSKWQFNEKSKCFILELKVNRGVNLNVDI